MNYTRNLVAAVTLLGLLFTLYINNTPEYPLLYFFSWSSAGSQREKVTLFPKPAITDPSDATMRLRHIFHHNIEGNINTLENGRYDVSNDDSVILAQGAKPFTVRGRSQQVSRLRDADNYITAQHQRILNSQKEISISSIDDWEFPEILVPDIRDKPTILTLATMSSNAYVLPGDIDWRNVTYGDNNPDSNNGDYNTSFGVGWEKPGVRGHVFLSDDNSTVILALKGTSAAVFDSGSETTPLDKLNDNLLFSCCCGRVSYLWTPVCDCYQGSAYRCDGECIERELIRNDRYYKATLNIYRDLARIYPHQNIWVTGHSLGGALAALLARTYAIPAVSFEAPGDLLAAKRLHLPFPPGIAPGEEYIWQFGHTADPIFMGVCNGVGSSCSLGGYAMETACHSGLNCVYDVVSDKGWHVNMLNHRIHTVIDEVLMDYDQPASCVNPGPCVDCFNWRFDKKESKESSKASSKTSSTVSLESPTQLSSSLYLQLPDESSKTTFTNTYTTTPLSTIPTSITPTIPITSPTISANPSHSVSSCLDRNWFGYCTRYA